MGELIEWELTVIDRRIFVQFLSHWTATEPRMLLIHLERSAIRLEKVTVLLQTLSAFTHQQTLVFFFFSHLAFSATNFVSDILFGGSGWEKGGFIFICLLMLPYIATATATGEGSAVLNVLKYVFDRCFDNSCQSKFLHYERQKLNKYSCTNALVG